MSGRSAVLRPAGFENRPAESDHRRPDGDIPSLFHLPCDGLRRLKEALPDTSFSLAREKRLALFFTSRTVQVDRARRRWSKRPKDAVDEHETVVNCCLTWIKRLARQERRQPLPWHPRQLVRFAFPRATK